MLNVHLHSVTRRSIRKHFVSTLSPGRRDSLFQRLESCPECADYYKQHHLAESALCNSFEASPFALERTEAALFHAMEEKPKASQRTQAVRRLAFVTAFSVVTAALVLLLYPQMNTDHRVPMTESAALAPVDLVARGGTSDGADVGVRVFKVKMDGGVIEDRNLTLDDIVTFTYTRALPGTGYIALFGIQAGEKVRWYYPDYGEGKSHAIDGDVVDEPLGDGIRLGVNHEPGKVRIVALFSDKPVSTETIEERAGELTNEATFDEAPGRLLGDFGDVTVQEHSFVIIIDE